MTLKNMFDEISDADMIAALDESNKEPHKNFLKERIDADGLFNKDTYEDALYDFKDALSMIMKQYNTQFAEGSFDDNADDVFNNYLMMYYESDIAANGPKNTAIDWFKSTYFNDEDGIFTHDLDESSKVDYNKILKESAEDKSNNSKIDYKEALRGKHMIDYKKILKEGFVYSEDEVVNKINEVAEHFGAEVSTGLYGVGINGDGWVIAYKDNSNVDSFQPPKIYFKRDGIVMGADYDPDDEMSYSSKTSASQIIDFIEKNLNAGQSNDVDINSLAEKISKYCEDDNIGVSASVVAEDCILVDCDTEDEDEAYEFARELSDEFPEIDVFRMYSFADISGDDYDDIDPDCRDMQQILLMVKA